VSVSGTFIFDDPGCLLQLLVMNNTEQSEMQRMVVFMVSCDLILYCSIQPESFHSLRVGGGLTCSAEQKLKI
jgi:hypothetical protein